MNFKTAHICLTSLTCERHERLLFQDLSFNIKPGTILRVAGPNGAGKTTLLRMIAGLFEIQQGKISIGGEPAKIHRARILYIGHKSQLAGDLSVRNNLIFLTGLQDSEVGNVLAAVNLFEYQDSLVRELSQGQGRRCALARLWCSKAPVWILDEPYTGLDVEMVNKVDKRLSDHVDAGGICIFTTHQSPHKLIFQTLEIGNVN